MKKLIFVMFACVVISCSKDEMNIDALSQTQETLSTTALSREISTGPMDNFAVVDLVMSAVFNKDVDELKEITKKIELKNARKGYSSNSQILQEFGISKDLSTRFVAIDWSIYLDKNNQVSNAFANGYLTYVCNNGTLINALSRKIDDSSCNALIDSYGNHNIEMFDDGNIAGLFGFLCGSNPCNLCNTIDTVVSSAGGMAVGCGLGGPVGCGVGVLNAADNIISYGQDCG